MKVSTPTSREFTHGTVVYRLLLFAIFVYLFLVGIKVFGGSLSLAGAGMMESLMSGFKNPFAGLAIGVIATAIMQSSSATTSLVITMVGTGQMSIASAIPIVMGANIGSTITCTIVAMGHVGDKKVFGRVFANANVHDMYNIAIALVLFPLEIFTKATYGVGFLESTAGWLTGLVASGGSEAAGALAFNPVNDAVSPVASALEWFFAWIPIFAGGWKALPGVVFALALIIVSLIGITKNMQVLMADKMEAWLNRVLKKHGYIGLAIGLGATMIVQSSSITTSLLIPMYAAGILNAHAAFPIIVGANIGTTITGLLASTVCESPAAITIALVHVLYNVSGMLMFFVVPIMREIPIRAAMIYGKLVQQHRVWAFVFIAMLFFVVPGVGIVVWKEPGTGKGTVPAAASVPVKASAPVVLFPDSGVVPPPASPDKIHSANKE